MNRDDALLDKILSKKERVKKVDGDGVVLGSILTIIIFFAILFSYPDWMRQFSDGILFGGTVVFAIILSYLLDKHFVRNILSTIDSEKAILLEKIDFDNVVILSINEEFSHFVKFYPEESRALVFKVNYGSDQNGIFTIEKDFKFNIQLMYVQKSVKTIEMFFEIEDNNKYKEKYKLSCNHEPHFTLLGENLNKIS